MDWEKVPVTGTRKEERNHREPNWVALIPPPFSRQTEQGMIA
jgi:hypothetical protein